MKELILEALRESVKRYPDIVHHLSDKATWIAIEGDLSLWQAKAITQVRNGEPALCEFESALIPDSVAEMVKNLLAYVDCEEQIKQGFIDLKSFVIQPTPSEKKILSRIELERKLTKVLSKDLQDELKKLLNYLGNPPNLSNVPYSYWQTGWKLIAKHAEPILVDFFVSQAIEAMEEVNMAVDVVTLSTDAIQWATNNSEQWLQQAFNKTYEGVNVLVPKAYEEGWTITELAKKLEDYHYSPVRAEMIAITEMTRAHTEGRKATERHYFEQFGVHRVPIWKTANDEKVCPVCGDEMRLDMPITDDMYPPAHPRCRCRINYLAEKFLTPKQREKWQSK